MAAIGNETSTWPPDELGGRLEAGVDEDVEHGRLLSGEHPRDEALDAGRGGEVRELLQQASPDAAALEVVGDGERDLRSPPGPAGGRTSRARPRVRVRRRHERPDRAPRSVPVRLDDEPTERGRERRKPVEAEVAAPLRQPLEERENRSPVGLGRRAEPERAPVLEDDVEHLRFRGHGPHHAVLAARRGP